MDEDKIFEIGEIWHAVDSYNESTFPSMLEEIITDLVTIGRDNMQREIAAYASYELVGELEKELGHHEHFKMFIASIISKAYMEGYNEAKNEFDNIIENY